MARGYTRTRVGGCGAGAAELWAAVLHEYDRQDPGGDPWRIGTVRQVYDRSAYLELRQEAISAMDPLGPPLVLLAGEGFDGPLATRLGDTTSIQPALQQLTPGAGCRLRTAAGTEAAPGYVVSIGEALDLEIDRSALAGSGGREAAYPDLAEITRAGPVFGRAVTALELLEDRGFEDGLDWLGPLLGLAYGRSPPRDLQRVIEWWTDQLAGVATGPASIDVLGRGPGATPSGDDVLAGFLLALLRTTSDSRRQRVQDAGRELVAAARQQTTDISTALLAQAVQGRASDSIDAAIRSLLAPAESGARLEPDLLTAAELGHTSGVDHLVGVLLTIIGVAPRIGERD